MHPTRTISPILLPTLVVALVALLVFTSTLSFYPFPGESAAMLVRYGGMDPLPTAYHPLYAMVAQCFSLLPMGTLAFRLGLVSTLSGAACVAILFVMVANLRYRRVHDDEAPFLPVIAGLPAAAYLLVAPPFWASANRAHPVLFHLCCLLLTLMLLQRYGRTGRLHLLGMSTFLFGLFLLEWAGNLLVFPFVLAAAVVYLHRNNHLHEERTLIPAVSFTVGVVTFIALFYARLAWITANLVDPPTLHLGRALGTLIGEHLYLLQQEFYGVDVVLIAIGSIVPWLVALVCARQEGESEAYSGAPILHLVLSLLCLILLFLDTVSPGMLHDLHGLAAVPPIVAIATVFGYVVGYWYVLADCRWGEQPAIMSKVLAAICISVGAVLLTAMKVNAARTSTQVAGVTHQWAGALLLPLPPGAVVIAPTNEQNILALTAREESHPITTIDLTRTEDPEYRSFIANTLAPESLRDLAELNIPRFLEAWTQHPDYPAGRVLTTDDPSFFERSGRAFQPSLAGYRDASPPENAWDHDLLERHQQFWEGVIPALRMHRSMPGFPGTFCRRLIGKASRTANDLAVLAREHEAYNDALVALQAARAMEFENVHATANRFFLLTQTAQSEDAASMWPTVDALVSSEDLPAERTEDGRLLGANRLRTFAEIRRSTPETLPDSTTFRDALAAYAIEEISVPESAGLAVTQKHPAHPAAWMLAGLLAADRGDTNRFAECTAQLASLGTDTTPLLIRTSLQAANQNQIPRARHLMQDAVTRQPADMDVLETIAAIELLAATPATQPVYLHRLLSLDPDNAQGHYALGARLLDEGERGRARQELVAAAAHGSDPRALLLAALLTDTEPEDPVSDQTADLALRCLDAVVDDAAYWNTLAAMYRRMELPGAAAYAAGQAKRIVSETPASLAYAQLLEAARPVEAVQVAAATPVAPPPVTVSPPPRRDDADLRTLLTQVIQQTDPEPTETAGVLPPPAPPTAASDLDDEDAPVPLIW